MGQRIVIYKRGEKKDFWSYIYYVALEENRYIWRRESALDESQIWESDVFPYLTLMKT